MLLSDFGEVMLEKQLPGSCVINRRMGIHSHPLEIQAGLSPSLFIEEALWTRGQSDAGDSLGLTSPWPDWPLFIGFDQYIKKGYVYSALRSAREMLTVNDGSKSLVSAINNLLG